MTVLKKFVAFAFVVFGLGAIPRPGLAQDLETRVDTIWASKGLEVFLRPDLSGYGRFSHVCGWSDGKKYKAILGAMKGTIFVDVTDNLISNTDIAFYSGQPSIWRECQTYTVRDTVRGVEIIKGYAYVTTEAPGGLQIFRIDGPRPVLVNTFDSTFTRAHTIFIDTLSGRAYVNGTRFSPRTEEDRDRVRGMHLGGMRILDLSDPENPKDLGGYGGHARNTYTHDSYAFGNILYAASIYKGLIRVLDVTDPQNIVVLDSLFTPLAFTHNVWMSDDGQWLFATDEQKGSGLVVYDASDPRHPRFARFYRSPLVHPRSIAHNVVVRGNIAYVSWYTEGVRLIDITNPRNPKEVGFFDTSLRDPAEGAMAGNWSVYVDDRGFVYLSDIDNGLFVLKPSKK